MNLFEKQPDGRMLWEHKVDKFFADFAADVEARWEDTRGIEEQAEEFADALDTQISNLKILVNTANEEEAELVPAWKLGIKALEQRAASMPRTGDIEALAGWMAGNENMPRNLRVTSAAGVYDKEEREILQKEIDGTDDAIERSKTGPRLEDVNPERLAAILGGADESALEAGERDRWTPESGNRRQTITPDEEFPGYQEYREAQQAATLEEQQAVTTAADLARAQRSPGVSPDGNQDGSQDGSQNGSGGNDPDELTPAAMQYIVENFGSVEFFYTRDDMQIDTNGDGTKDTNIIDWIITEEEENPDVIWGLFQQTDWFAENGPAARQFQMDWAKADGTFDWTPQYEVGSGTWNMTPDMEELLDDTYDSLVLEASRLGINTDDPDKKNAIMQMAYNAKQLNMTDFEIKNEFATGFKGAFDINKVQGSGTFLNIKQQLRQNAATYMLKLDDATLNDYAQKVYLGKATYDGISAGHAQSVMDQEPALRSLVEQGYTPSAYFSSYSNVASELLGRPVDFLGSDSKLYSHLKDTMVANDGLNRPMTRGEFERYVRSTPEWDTSENARDEAYGTVGTLLNSFGIRV